MVVLSLYLPVLVVLVAVRVATITPDGNFHYAARLKFQLDRECAPHRCQKQSGAALIRNKSRILEQSFPLTALLRTLPSQEFDSSATASNEG